MGRWFVYFGFVIIAVGLVMILLERFGFFRLPGDIHIKGRGWSFYFPVVSCIILSILLTLIMWIISYFKK